ncbi:hypothetical protein [Streptacidiphilus sp. MAP5-52]|uniref:hypothetical protein n=1 Tax=Streptacidiphilus sp. MAP5-52 TaxID=3156267 RepID=UPI003517F768
MSHPDVYPHDFEELASRHEAHLRERAGIRRLPGGAGRSVQLWTELLDHVEDVGDLAAILDLVGFDDQGAAMGLYNFLDAAARKADDLPGAARAAEQLRKLAGQVDYVGGRLNGISYGLFRNVPDDVAAQPGEPTGLQTFQVSQAVQLSFRVRAADEADARQQVLEMETVEAAVDVSLGGGFVLEDVVFGELRNSTVAPTASLRAAAATSRSSAASPPHRTPPSDQGSSPALRMEPGLSERRSR